MNIISTVYAAEGVSISTLENPASKVPISTSISGLLTLTNGVNILNLIFLFVGLFFFVNLVMAGWDFMMSSGDPKKIAAATTRIQNGFIGLIMAFTAFIVVRIIVTMLGLGTLI